MKTSCENSCENKRENKMKIFNHYLWKIIFIMFSLAFSRVPFGCGSSIRWGPPTLAQGKDFSVGILRVNNYEKGPGAV